MCTAVGHPVNNTPKYKLLQSARGMGPHENYRGNTLPVGKRF